MSKKQLNEWNDRSFKDLPKRWSKSTTDNKDGLTEFERQGSKDIKKPKTPKNPKNMKWS